MRNQPIEATPWESEAARRREVIEADFGSPHAHHRIDHVTRSQAIGPLRRIATWVATFARTNGQAAAGRVDLDAACQPGIHAVRPGS
jgi:hypothetical protein